MLSAKTKLKNAENLKQFLLERNLIDTNFTSKVKQGEIFFPVKEEIKKNDYKIKLNDFKSQLIEINLKEKEKKISLEDLLKEKLNSQEMKLIPKTQEIVGDIMIIEIPEELEKKEKMIAEVYLKLNKQIKTIVKKTEIHSGTFRTRKVKVIAGKNKKETTHFENGIRLKLDIEKTYFSARLANERLRIAKQVKLNEKILVMFSGSLPYPLVLAKNSPAKEIIGIEINPDAHKFALNNVKLNKINGINQKKGKNNNQNTIIELINGDVRTVLPNIDKKFDRILMPLPKTSEEFLDIALPKIKNRGIIHLYSFLNEKDIDNEKIKIINLCDRLGFKIDIINTIKCGQHAPYTFRVCFDLKCQKNK